MSEHVQLFVEGYRGHRLETEKRIGVEHLKTGQHEAIWNDPEASEEERIIELSYVPIDGHSFVLLFLRPESLEILHMVRVDSISKLQHLKVPEDFELTDEMRQAVMRLKTQVLST